MAHFYPNQEVLGATLIYLVKCGVYRNYLKSLLRLCFLEFMTQLSPKAEV